jgi:hypothetical protein
MKKLILFAALAALMIPFASATVPLGYVQLSGTYLQDSTGTMVANATISFAPVNASGVPISYQVNGHGQAIFSPVTALVTGGAFTVQLADTALTNPVNVCFAVTVTDNVSGKSVLGPGYNCVQPAGSGVAVTGPNAWCTAAGASGGTCNFDLYIPNEAALVVTQVGPTGPPGTNGNTLWNGTSAPSSGLGLNGDFYLNTASSCLYGPKASGAWPTLCTMLATGPTGAAGTNGNTIWNGTSAPSSGLGANGDFYLNTVSSCLYGPKASGAWPTPCTSLIGPQGAAGPQGATGPPGSGGGGGSYTLPIAQPGTLGGVKPDGSSCTVNASTGVLSCVGSGGGVASVAGTAPVVSSGGSTPAISMHVSDASDNGYLASADWAAFNGKQAALSLLKGTYVDGDMCTYTASGTLLNCNTAIPSGSIVNVNSASVGSPNFNNSVPAADPGFVTGTFKVSGSNVSVEVPGMTSTRIVSGANVIFTGDSAQVDDGNNVLGADTTATAVSCTSSGLCTITVPNSYIANQWVDFHGASGFSPSCLGIGPSGTGYYGTRTQLFQVLAAGLSSAQIEVQSNCTATTGTGGLLEDATFFLPVQAAATPAFSGVNAWYLRNGIDVASIYGGTTGLVCEQATNFTAMFGDLLPSVTGKPLYLLSEAGANDIFRGDSISHLKGCFQSFWSQAHAAGAYIIQNTIPLIPGSYGADNSGPTADLNNWLIVQGKNMTNVSAGQYWDYAGVDMRTYGKMSDPFSAPLIALVSQAWDAALASPGTSGFTLTSCNPVTDCAQLSTINAYIYEQVTTAAFVARHNSDAGTGSDYSIYISMYGLIPFLGFNFAWNGGQPFLVGMRQGSGSMPNGVIPGTDSLCWNTSTSGGSSQFNDGVIGFSIDASNNYIDVGSCTTNDYSKPLRSAGLGGPATAPSGSCSLPGEWVLSQDGAATRCLGGTWATFSGGGGGGLSGMTAGQVPLAATPSTATSSKPLAGTGAGIATGPTTTTLNDCVKYGDTVGTLADAGAACGSGGGLTLTTTGSGGAATYNGGTLNIPVYSGGSGSSGPTFDQYTYVSEQSGSLAYITSPSMTVAAGDLVVIFCRSASTFTFTSSPSESWNALPGVSQSSLARMGWAIIGTAGVHTFTCTPTTSTGSMASIVLDFSGTGTTLNGSTNFYDNNTNNPVYSNDSGSVLTTTQRTINVFCATTGSVSHGWWFTNRINGVPAVLAGVSGATLQANSDSACTYTISPFAMPNAVADMLYGGSTSNWAGTFAAFNY